MTTITNNNDIIIIEKDSEYVYKKGMLQLLLLLQRRKYTNNNNNTFHNVNNETTTKTTIRYYPNSCSYNNIAVNMYSFTSRLLILLLFVLSFTITTILSNNVEAFTTIGFNNFKHQQSPWIISTSTSHRRNSKSYSNIESIVLKATRIKTISKTKNVIDTRTTNLDDNNDNDDIENQNNVVIEDITNVVPELGITKSESIQLRMKQQLERLQLKDQMSPKLSSEELDIVYEDDHLIVVNKPAGVLSVSGKDKNNNSLVQAIYEYVNNKKQQQQQSFKYADHMVVHRLGMDISGVMVFAKTIDAVRGLHTSFRTRKVDRTYEILVCGHVPKNKGRITLPLMRDYEHPLYMRISTDQHQEMLIDLDPDIVGKKLLEPPKECITEYKVLSRDTMNSEPITRLLVRSVSGRMHQINCHFAAIGHPLVGDVTYGGMNDMASPNGGLSDDEIEYILPKPYNHPLHQRVSIEQQIRTMNGSNNNNDHKNNNNNNNNELIVEPTTISITNPACHAKSIRFRHPITKKTILFESDAPF